MELFLCLDTIVLDTVGIYFGGVHLGKVKRQTFLIKTCPQLLTLLSPGNTEL